MALPLKPKRILVVDDNPELADLLVEVFRQDGHDASAVYGGADAIQSTLNRRPEVVVLDLSMPDFDGFTVAKSLRQQDTHEDLILVAYSSWGGTQVASKAIDSGFNHYFTKPNGLNDLLALIESI